MDAKHPLLLLLILSLVACKGTPTSEAVEDFKSLYDEVTFADNVVGVVPLPSEREGNPPIVVNWLYAGTADQTHRVVLRRATWDASGQPEMSEQWYAVSDDQLSPAEPMAVTRDVSRWVPLHETDSRYAPPPGVETWRESIKPEAITPEDDPSPLPPGFVPGELPE